MTPPPPISPLFPSPPLSRPPLEPPHLLLTLVPPEQSVDELIPLALLNRDRKSTRLNSSHSQISYAVFCLKKKKQPSSDRDPPLLSHPARSGLSLVLMRCPAC